MDGDKVVECLIVTTESSHLFVLDPETFNVVEQRKVKRSSFPARNLWVSKVPPTQLNRENIFHRP